MSIPIIDFFKHPPFGALPPLVVDATTYYGDYDFDSFVDVDGGSHEVRNTYGLVWIGPAGDTGFPVAPVGSWTREPGWNSADGQWTLDIFEQRLLQVVAVYQTAFGLSLPGQVENCHTQVGFVLWEQALPGRVGIYTAPGFPVFLSWFVIPGS